MLTSESPQGPVPTAGSTGEPPAVVPVGAAAEDAAADVFPSAERAAAARRTVHVLSDDTDVWEAFFDKVQIGLALAGLDSRFLRVNETYAAILGRAPEDLVGEPFTDVLAHDDADGTDGQVEQLLQGARSAVSTERRYLSSTGQRLWVLHGITLVRTADGQPGWFAASAQDITERRHAEQELRDLTNVLAERAVRDALTGVANRTLVEERLRQALARDARTGGSTGLLFMDLDGFKAVNDRHGHSVGDEVLKVVAERLQGAVRPSDTVARLGGDEFVVLAEGVVADGLAALVHRLESAVREPIAVSTLSLDVGVSIGQAVSTAGELDAATLLARADAAMYGAKRNRSRRSHGYVPSPPPGS